MSRPGSRPQRRVIRTVVVFDDRLGTVEFLHRNIRKAFPKHWSFLLGEIALYSFIVLVITGVFLTFFFKPSHAEVIYNGAYAPLRGLEMSEAYASTLEISFNIRGGLLMRQIHHWGALIFLAAISIHLMRIFFTGAFRKPREVNWVIGVTLLILALAEGFAGYSLPDDLLSGTGLRTFHGIILSVPVVGTYLAFFIFGGEYPGTDLIPRLFTMHVLLVPGLLVALITAHLMILWHQTHTQWPGKDRREGKVSGEPTFPHFAAQSGAYFMYTFGFLALMAGFLQINPVWLYGPYKPEKVSMFSQPDWYVGFLEGALRTMPAVSTTVGGHTVIWNVFIPGVVAPGVFFTLILFYPFFERWATGDDREHHILDRPRNAATRTAIGAAAIAWYGNLWAAGGNDVISFAFGIPLYVTTWMFRVGFFLLPILAFVITRRLCLSLQRRDLQTAKEGVESGIIRLGPEGGFHERHERAGQEEAVMARARRPRELVARHPHPLLPLPTPGRIKTRVRTRVNRFYLDYHGEVTDGGQGVHHDPAGDGEGDGDAKSEGNVRSRILNKIGSRFRVRRKTK